MVRTNGVNKTAYTALVMAAGMLVMCAGAAKSDELVTIEKALYGPYGRPTLLVANSADEWNQMMGALANEGSLAVVPGPEAPQVDWSRYAVVLVAAGQTGYDVSLKLTQHSNGTVSLDPVYVPLANDAGESLPYYLGMTEKHPWLKTQVWQDADVAGALPMSGGDTSMSTVSLSWGAVKASYR